MLSKVQLEKRIREIQTSLNDWNRQAMEAKQTIQRGQELLANANNQINLHAGSLQAYQEILQTFESQQIESDTPPASGDNE